MLTDLVQRMRAAQACFVLRLSRAHALSTCYTVCWCLQTMVQRMRAAQEAMESETKEEEFYLKALLVRSNNFLLSS